MKFLQADRLRTQIYSRIQEVMEEENISQGEVARRIGTARPNVNKIMRSHEGASIDLLVKIAESVGLDMKLTMIKLETLHKSQSAMSGQATAGSRKEK